MKVRRMCLRTNIPEENSLLGSPGRAEEEGRCFEGEPGTNVQKCYRYKFTVDMVTPDGFDLIPDRVEHASAVGHTLHGCAVVLSRHRKEGPPVRRAMPSVVDVVTV
jgi:hypothetical protein